MSTENPLENITDTAESVKKYAPGILDWIRTDMGWTGIADFFENLFEKFSGLFDRFLGGSSAETKDESKDKQENNEAPLELSADQQKLLSDKLNGLNNLYESLGVDEKSLEIKDKIAPIISGFATGELKAKKELITAIESEENTVTLSNTDLETVIAAAEDLSTEAAAGVAKLCSIGQSLPQDNSNLSKDITEDMYVANVNETEQHVIEDLNILREALGTDAESIKTKKNIDENINYIVETPDLDLQADFLESSKNTSNTPKSLNMADIKDAINSITSQDSREIQFEQLHNLADHIKTQIKS